MKSSFGENDFLAILEVLNLDIGQFEQFFKSQISQNSKFRVSKIVKKAIIEIQILPKIDFSKIGWQSDFHTVGLNFIFSKFLEQSVLASTYPSFSLASMPYWSTQV